jgi:hypothetical protein
LPSTRQFTLISLTHVIEHLADPKSMLMHLETRTSIGGSIYILAPFRPPLWSPRDGLRPWLTYSYLHVPAHISYLSEKWFKIFIADTNFDLVHWDNSLDGFQVFEAVLRKRA